LGVVWKLTALVTLLAAGCRFGFDQVPNGDGRGGDDDDGSGSAQLDAMVDGSPNVDTDGDGVNDDVDNCIFIQNADQHDEDADFRGDVCDNCPTVANNDQANLLEIMAGNPADTVGDACDPRPTADGESIVYFDALNRASLGADWTVINGTWSMGSDSMTTVDLLSDQRVHDVAAGTVVDYLVETTFTFTGIDTGNVNGGVLFHMQGNNGWLCAVFHDSTIAPPSSLLLWTIQNGAANFQRARADLAVESTVGASYRIIGGAYGQERYCALDSMVTGTRATPFTSNQFADGPPGYRANRVTGTYSYLLVYGLGGPP
jgi:hypothetical protein